MRAPMQVGLVAVTMGANVAGGVAFVALVENAPGQSRPVRNRLGEADSVVQPPMSASL